MKPILALYPNNRGFGFAYIQIPHKLIDSGIVNIRPVCNSRIIRRIEKQLDFYRPAIVVIRDNNTLSFRGKRIEALIEEITVIARQKGLPIHYYSREQVKETFQQFGAETKYAISQKILAVFKELIPLAPAPRKKWLDEDYNMGIFDAIALALTHEYLS